MRRSVRGSRYDGPDTERRPPSSGWLPSGYGVVLISAAGDVPRERPRGRWVEMPHSLSCETAQLGSSCDCACRGFWHGLLTRERSSRTGITTGPADLFTNVQSVQANQRFEWEFIPYHAGFVVGSPVNVEVGYLPTPFRDVHCTSHGPGQSVGNTLGFRIWFETYSVADWPTPPRGRGTILVRCRFEDGSFTQSNVYFIYDLGRP